MKYTSYIKTLLAAALLNLSAAAFAQNSRLPNNVERSVASAQAQAQQAQEAAVSITATFQKAVKMSDVMCRRPRCKDQIISYETKTNICRGTLAKSGVRVYTTANCMRHKDFALSTVTLKFANGRTASGGHGAVGFSGDIAYVAVQASVTRGLNGLDFAVIPQGKSLMDVFGDEIESFLLSFFHEKGVPARRRARVGRISTRHPTVKLGDPVLYNGKVIALVKQVPYIFRRGPFVGVSEKPFAIIRL